MTQKYAKTMVMIGHNACNNISIPYDAKIYKDAKRHVLLKLMLSSVIGYRKEIEGAVQVY